MIAVTALAIAQHWIPAALLAPQLRALDDSDIPTATFVSAVVGITIAYQTTEPVPLIWRLAPLRARLRGTARVAALTAVYLGTTVTIAPTWTAAVLNVTLTTLTETLIMLAYFDRRLAWVTPALHCTISALLGRQLFGQLSWWAWPANPKPGLAYALTALLIGAVVMLSRFHHHRRRRQTI